MKLVVTGIYKIKDTMFTDSDQYNLTLPSAFNLEGYKKDLDIKSRLNGEAKVLFQQVLKSLVIETDINETRRLSVVFGLSVTSTDRDCIKDCIVHDLQLLADRNVWKFGTLGYGMIPLSVVGLTSQSYFGFVFIGLNLDFVEVFNTISMDGGMPVPTPNKEKIQSTCPDLKCELSLC